MLCFEYLKLKNKEWHKSACSVKGADKHPDGSNVRKKCAIIVSLGVQQLDTGTVPFKGQLCTPLNMNPLGVNMYKDVLLRVLAK